MSIVAGTRCFGCVDRIPGIGYVATQFFHINFIPLVPTQTYFVLAGSETGLGSQGHKLPTSGKSILAAYLRGWGWVACATATAICWYSLSWASYSANWSGIAGVVVGGLLAAGAILFWNRLWIIAQTLYHLGSLGWWGTLLLLGHADGVLNLSVPIANALLLLHSLTRLLNVPGRLRAMELMTRIGYDRERAEEILDEPIPRRRPARPR